MGQHYGADVSSVHDDAPLPSKIPLHFQQKGPDAGVRGYHGGVLGDLGQADGVCHIFSIEDHALQSLRVMAQFDAYVRQCCQHCRLIRRVQMIRIGIIGNGPVDRAGVHIQKVKR